MSTSFVLGLSLESSNPFIAPDVVFDHRYRVFGLWIIDQNPASMVETLGAADWSDRSVIAFIDQLERQ